MSASGARFGIEYRFPYFDRRLVEFSLAVPPEHKLGGGWTRLLQRQALAEILPSEVCWRPKKASVASNFGRSLLAHERKTIEDTVCEPAAELGPFVRPEELRAIANRTEDAACLPAVWLSLTLAAWLRQAKPST